MILSSWETEHDWTYKVYDLNSPPEEFRRFEGFVRLWNDKRKDGKLPAWRDFDINDFEGWWGWITVMDLDITREEGSEHIDATYRLWGSSLTELLGVDLTGQSIRSRKASFDELDSGFSRHDFKLFGDIVNGPAIGCAMGKIYWEAERSFVLLTNFRMPLADDGRTVDKLMSVIQRDAPLARV